MSHGQAPLSTLTSLRVIHFTANLLPTNATLRMRRASLHLLSGANRIGGVADDFVSRLEVTEDLYIAAHTQTGDHIHPFRLPIAYALHEGAFLLFRHRGARNEHGYSGAMDGPFDTA